MELSQFYRDLLQTTEEGLIDTLVRASRVRTFQSGQTLIVQGEVPTSLFFLLQGVMRGYAENEDGKEMTDCIVCRCGDPVMADNDYHLPASITIEALEESTVTAVPLTLVEQLLEQWPQLMGFYRSLVTRSAQLHRELKILVYQRSAAERYQWFLQAYPGLIDRIPHRYVASYLNMTPVTLSRMRHQLREQTTED